MTERPEISIVIPTYKAKEHLRLALESIRREAGHLSIEVIVVDNASGDGSSEMVEEEFPEVRLVRLDVNVGCGPGINRGTAVARGEYILFMDNDAQLLPGAVDKALEFLKSNPEYGAVAGRILSPDQSRQFSVMNFPTLGNSFITFWGIERAWRRRPFWRYRIPQDMYDNAMDTDWLAGPFMLMRAPILQQIGPRDEEMFHFGDELEFCKRIRDAGHKIRFLPYDAVIHEGSVSTCQIGLGNLRINAYEGMLQYYRKHHPGQATTLKGIMISGLIVRLGLLVGMVFRRGLDPYCRETLRSYRTLFAQIWAM